MTRSIQNARRCTVATTTVGGGRGSTRTLASAMLAQIVQKSCWADEVGEPGLSGRAGLSCAALGTPSGEPGTRSSGWTCANETANWTSNATIASRAATLWCALRNRIALRAP
jgi:hypothetical protein